MRQIWVGIAVRCLICFAVSVATHMPVAVAANQSEADSSSDLSSLVNDDTFAIAEVNLATVSANGGNWIVGPLAQQLTQFLGTEAAEPAAVGKAIGSLNAAGAERAFVVMGLGDLYLNGGPLLVVTADLDHPPSGVEAVLQRLSNEIAAVNPALPNFGVRRHGSRSVLFGPEQTVARYAAIIASERSDLVEPLHQLSAEGATVALVFSPGSEFRRVVRELWPSLPEPLAAWKGELADRWLRLEFAAQLQGVPSARLVMRATDAASAELFAKLLRSLPSACEQFREFGDARQDLQRYLQLIVDAVPPEVEGMRVVMQLPTDAAKLAKLTELTSEAKEAALESTRRRQRMQKFKEISLAILNYESAKKHLPPPAICDANGKPLLSWRVAILPYLDQTELYKKFRLDEPWDSPHNLPWSKVMVEAYSDPAFPELARESKTTYVLPAGAGTALDSKTGATFRDIRDGTSMTIMLVEVPPEGAVVWTKPEDWEVDMDDPFHGLRRTDRDYFAAAWCDGRASIIRTDVKPEVLKAILTRAGSETVDRP